MCVARCLPSDLSNPNPVFSFDLRSLECLGFSAGWAAHQGDANLQATVETALRADKHILANHVDVSVKDGVVRLSGFVQDDAALRKADKDASDVLTCAVALPTLLHDAPI
jgi:BON domain